MLCVTASHNFVRDAMLHCLQNSTVRTKATPQHQIALPI